MFDARAVPAAGGRQSSLRGRIHDIPPVEWAGTQMPKSVPSEPAGIRSDDRDSFRIQSEPIDEPPLYQVAVDDFIEILSIDIGVPDGLRVNHGHRAQLAAVQTARVIDPDLTRSRDTEFLATLLHVIARLLRATLVTALAAVFTLIGTKEHMAGKITHTSFRARQ